MKTAHILGTKSKQRAVHFASGPAKVHSDIRKLTNCCDIRGGHWSPTQTAQHFTQRQIISVTEYRCRGINVQGLQLCCSGGISAHLTELVAHQNLMRCEASNKSKCALWLHLYNCLRRKPTANIGLWCHCNCCTSIQAQKLA